MVANSVKTVEKVLDNKTQKTLQDILNETHLNPRTVRWALRELRREDRIIEKINFRDMRKTWYTLKVPRKVEPCKFLDVCKGETRCAVLHPESDLCRRESPNKFTVGDECFTTGG